MAIIHLAQPSPVGSSDLPGGRSALFTARIGRAALVDASLFGLALRGVCLAAYVATRAGALLLISNLNLKLEISPCGPHRFTHHLCFRFEISESERTGWSVLCCTCRRPSPSSSEISNLKFEI